MTLLKQLGERHFGELFKDDDSTNLVDQLKLIRPFPTLTEEEDVDSFLEPITSQEVEEVLKGFKKDKIPGPDGWPIELFQAFFDLIGMNWSWLLNKHVLGGDPVFP